MPLLKRQQRSKDRSRDVGSWSKASAVERYRALELFATPLADRGILMFNPATGKTHFMTPAQSQMLQFCKTPRPIDGHATAYLRWLLAKNVRPPTHTSRPSRRQTMLSWMSRTLAAGRQPGKARKELLVEVTERFRQFAADNLLIADSDLLGGLMPAAQTAPSPAMEVSTVGIPTRGRVDSLRRLLLSVARNCRRAAKSPTIMVSDDSTSTDVLSANQHVAAQVGESESLRILHLDRAARLGIARLLAVETGADLDIVNFGLLGDQRLGVSCGASRNTLLLCSAGLLSLQMDDDTVCDIRRMKVAGTAPRLSFEAARSANEYTFYESMAECTGAYEKASLDFLDVHASLLGRKVSECIAACSPGELHLGDLSRDLHRRLLVPESRIAMTSMGIVGASGTQQSSWRLFLNGGSHERLVASDVEFGRCLRTDYIGRAPRGWCVSDTNAFMATGIGLDLRSPLPPFMPIFRNEDGVFGTTVHVCAPDALLGWIPYSILHDPPDRRRRDAIDPLDMRTNDILRRLIYGSRPWSAVMGHLSSLDELGRYLVELSALKRDAFRDLIHAVICASLSEKVVYLERRLDEERGQPPHWAREVRQYQARLVQAAAQPEYFGPADIPGELDQRLLILQSVCGKFGRLLRCWPDLFECARRLLRPVEELITTRR